MKRRLPGRAGETDAADLARLVTEVGAILAEDLVGERRALLLETKLVVAGDDDLVRVRLLAPPGREPLELVAGAAATEVASVHEHVAGGQRAEVRLEGVRAGHGDHADQSAHGSS